MSNALLAHTELIGGNFPVLTAIVLVPAIGALLITLLTKRRPELVKLTAILFSVFTGALTVWMLCSFKTGTAGFQFCLLYTSPSPRDS